MARIAAASAQLPIGESSFAMNIRKPRRSFRRAQILAQIQQVDPSAVAKAPFRLRIALHLDLGIDVRPPRVQNSLLQREAIPPQRELGRYAHRPRKEAFRCELNRLPVDRT